MTRILFLYFLLFLPVMAFPQTDREFWFAAPAVCYQTVAPSPILIDHLNQPIALNITTATGPAHVKIEQPANPSFVPIYKTVNNFSAGIVVLTSVLEQVENKPANTILNKGLLITSDQPVTVTYEVQSRYNAATYTLDGRNALGTEFIIPSQFHYNNYQYTSPQARNVFDIVATEDSTFVTIIPSHAIIGHAAHDTFSVLLHRGQSWSGRAASGDSLQHLGGTFVFSNNPIAITITDDGVIFPNNMGGQFDIVGDQLIPTRLGGTDFILPNLQDNPGMKPGARVIVYAIEDGTEITCIDSVHSISRIVERGKFAEFSTWTDSIGLYSFAAASIHANKPVIVYMIAGESGWGGMAQAYATMVPPIRCGGSKRVSFTSTPPYGLWHWFEVDIVTRNGYQGYTTGLPFNPGWSIIPGTNGKYVKCVPSWLVSMYSTITVSNPMSNLQVSVVGGAYYTDTNQFIKSAFISDFSALSLGPDRRMCTGDSIMLDAGYGRDSYLWNTGATSQMIVVTNPGTYWVTILQDSCTLSDTIVLSSYWNQPVNLGPDRQICTGDSTLLDAGAGRTWYEWSTGATTQTIWVKNAGTYRVKARDVHCVVFDTIDISLTAPPVINTFPPASSQCSGDTTQIGLTSSVQGTVYHWTASLTSGNVTGFSADSGLVIRQRLLNPGPLPGMVTYHITPKAGSCVGAAINYQVTVNPEDSVKVSIAASANPVCDGTTATFSAIQVNQGASPVYQWKVNGSIAGSNLPVFSYYPVNGDTVLLILTSSNTVCTSNNPATSNKIRMVVSPNLPVSISIAPSSNPFCSGTSVMFTATSVNSGTMPVYQWKVNGNPTGSTNSTFAYIPGNGDLVTCQLTSSESCTTGNPATSNTVNMIVNNSLPAGISISASVNPFCPGSTVIFTATPNNGGSIPIYQWKVNGSNAGTNSSTLSYNPVIGDSVRCILTSNLSCVTGNPVSSAQIIMNGLPAPFVTITPCFDLITMLNAKPFKLKGGLPLGGTYSGPGIDTITGMFFPSVAGTGVKSIKYSYINVTTCKDEKSITITVLPDPLITCGNMMTDVRDGKQYKTFMLPNGKCWMSSNLEFGTLIDDWSPQTDNCMAEYYSMAGASISGPAPSLISNFKSEISNLKFEMREGMFYQWDELMQYNPTPGSQGLCPPGWHVPTAAEWDELLTFFNGAGQAGGPMKDTLLPTGFQSLQRGFLYQNNTWAFLEGLQAGSLYWTSTMVGDNRAVARGLNDYNPSVSMYHSLRGNGLGVRCLRD